MSDKQLKKIVIVGGGTAGWMSAALLSKFMSGSGASITLIESEQIGTIGVGEATIPHIQNFNNMLDIDEATFLKETGATYKLGIEFADWGELGERYLHPFGEYGIPMGELQFHHYWTRMKQSGSPYPIGDYCLNVVAAKAGKFMHPVQDQTSLAARIPYAYHLDATRYAQFLRRYAEGRNACRIEGKVVETALDAETGHIQSVKLETGETIEGDFFIDCSGFRGVLIEGALKAGYEDWSDLLPMDRAVTVHSEVIEPPKPYTIATAKDAGWTWRIPLQARVGNGYVYSSKFIDKEAATDVLLNGLDSEAITEPRHLAFNTGRRKTFWRGNCLALGLSTGFLEPLESTSIHLIQEGLIRLVALMPDKSFNPANEIEYNRVMDLTYERIRDFILLHYVATRRVDTPFWRYIQNLDIPQVMAHRMKLLSESGHYVSYEHDLFKLDSWIAVMEGQGMAPQTYSPIAEMLSDEDMNNTMGQLRYAISEITRQMPTHGQYIQHVVAKG
mgnify:CR=1 FL=1